MAEVNLSSSEDDSQLVTGPSQRNFPRLESVNVPALTTAAAAHYLNRKPQTLRVWACHGNGPIKPVRVYGRLAWPVNEIRRVLGVAYD